MNGAHVVFCVYFRERPYLNYLEAASIHRTELRMRIREIAQARVLLWISQDPRTVEPRRLLAGYVGKYLVYRLYTEEGLSLKRMKAGGQAQKLRDDRATGGSRSYTAPDPNGLETWTSWQINCKRMVPDSAR